LLGTIPSNETADLSLSQSVRSEKASGANKNFDGLPVGQNETGKKLPDLQRVTTENLTHQCKVDELLATISLKSDRITALESKMQQMVPYELYRSSKDDIEISQVSEEITNLRFSVSHTEDESNDWEILAELEIHHLLLQLENIEADYMEHMKASE
jgi:adenylate cyclase